MHPRLAIGEPNEANRGQQQLTEAPLCDHTEHSCGEGGAANEERMSSGAGSSRSHAAQGDPTHGGTIERANAKRPLRYDLRMCNCHHADYRGCLAAQAYPGLGYGRFGDLCMFCESYEDSPLCRCPCRVCRHPESGHSTPDLETVCDNWDQATCRKYGYCQFRYLHRIIEHDECVYCNGPSWAASDWGSSGDSDWEGSDVTNLSYVQTPDGFGEHSANEHEHESEEAPGPQAPRYFPPVGATVIDLTTPDGSEGEEEELQVVETRLASDGEDDEDVVMIPEDHVTVLRQGGNQ